MSDKLAKNIKRYRKEKNWTQAKLAEEANISLMSVRRYETVGDGNREPKFETIQKIAKALDISTSELYGIEFNDKEINIVEPSLEEIMQEISDLRYSLNKEGLLKTKDYMYDLMGNPKYKTD